MGKIKVITKTHIQRTKAKARAMGSKYGMAILKWDNERTMVTGGTKAELRRFAKTPLQAGDFKRIKIVPAGKPPKQKRKRR